MPDLYAATENDTKFPNDIHEMMVAPLNGWFCGEDSMFGMLYISSPNKNTFSEIHIDSAAFLADTLANFIATQVELMSWITEETSEDDIA